MDINELNQSVDHKKHWTPKTFRCTFYDLDGTKRDVDLLDYCPDEPNPGLKWRYAANDERLYFPSNLEQPGDVALYINKQSCMKNGYCLTVIRGSTSQGKAVLSCEHGRKRRKSRSVTTQLSYSSKANTDKNLCKFKLRIARDDVTRPWYLRKNAGHCLCHSGHIEVEPKKKYQPLKLVKDKFEKEAMRLLGMSLPTNVVSEVIHHDSDIKLSKASLKRLRQRMTTNETGSDKSIADELIEKMDGNENITYIAYYGDYSEATQVIRVRKRSRKKKKSRKSLRRKSTKKAESTMGTTNTTLASTNAIFRDDTPLCLLASQSMESATGETPRYSSASRSMEHVTDATTLCLQDNYEDKSTNEYGQPVVGKTKSMTCDSIVEYNSDVREQTSERGKCATEKKLFTQMVKEFIEQNISPSKKVCKGMIIVLGGSFIEVNSDTTTAYDIIGGKIKHFGGEVRKNMSNRTTHFLHGENTASGKLKKAKERGMEIIGLHQLIHFVQDQSIREEDFDKDEGKFDEDESKFDEEEVDIHDQGKAFIRALIKGLSIKDGTILLALMWVTKTGKLYHRKFPHVLGLDVTHGTNAEKRGLFRASGKTSNNRNFPLINAYIPSEQRWLFHWCITKAIPFILDKEDLKKTRMIVSDQDAQLTAVLADELDTIRDGTHYGLARHRHCKWHKVNRGYTIKMTDASLTGEDDNKFKEIMKNWFYTFTDKIETKAQEVDSIEKLMHYIDQVSKTEKVSERLITFTKSFIRESFVPNLGSLCFRHYMDVYWGDVGANSFTEGDNSSLKRDIRGPNANYNLCASSNAITSHVDRRIDHLQKSSVKNHMRQQFLKQSDEGNTLEESRAKLSEHINEYKQEIALDQFEDSTNYTYILTEEDSCQLNALVLRKNDEGDKKSDKINDPIPRYHRTRQVTIKEEVIEETSCVVIKCSCMHFDRQKCPCRHIYCIIHQAPDVVHFSPDCLLHYELFYGEEGMERFTGLCDRITNIQECHGGLVLWNTTLSEFKSQMKEQRGDIELYKKALSDLGVDVTPRDESIAAQLSAYKCDDVNSNTKRKPSAQESTIKSYRECCNVAKTEEDFAIINSALTTARGEIMMKNSRGSGVNTQKGVVKDMPAVESKPTEKRKMPPGSPTKNKNQKFNY